MALSEEPLFLVAPPLELLRLQSYVTAENDI
jgi:hypothetical protein